MHGGKCPVVTADADIAEEEGGIGVAEVGIAEWQTDQPTRPEALLDAGASIQVLIVIVRHAQRRGAVDDTVPSLWNRPVMRRLFAQPMSASSLASHFDQLCPPKAPIRRPVLSRAGWGR